MKVILSNSQDASEELEQIIEAIESLEGERAETAKLIRERYQDAKGRGYDPKALRKLISERKRDPEDVAEEEAVLDMYRAALGMAHAQTYDTADMV